MLMFTSTAEKKIAGKKITIIDMDKNRVYEQVQGIHRA